MTERGTDLPEGPGADKPGFRLSPAVQVLAAGALVLVFLAAAVPAFIRFQEKHSRAPAPGAGTPGEEAAG